MIDFEAIKQLNPQMNEVLEHAKRVSLSAAPILISGLVGTGKSALAKFIHHCSRREGLLILEARSPLFDESWNVKILDSQVGTILIEDVDWLSFEVQSDLLRWSEQNSTQASSRLICTSRRDLRQLARQDQFRQDLYYKLSVVQLQIPSLGQRPEDVRGLAEFILDVNSILHGKRGVNFTTDAWSKILNWNWPGNVSELENVIERAVLLAKGIAIGPELIRFESLAAKNSAEFSAGMSLSEVEKRLILQTLELTSQNRTKAAQILGISIRTLRNKLNDYREARVS